jgi:hypothetical protein
VRAKDDNPFKLSFFGAGVVVSAKHISSAPKGESSSTVELQIGGVAAPELVWWSWSSPKHALTHHRNGHWTHCCKDFLWLFGLQRDLEARLVVYLASQEFYHFYLWGFSLVC